MRIVILIIFISMRLQAFPEMIRHHYTNCSACHVSNSGGGLLNAYGRTISYELLSTWGTEKEARAFYSVNPETVGSWLNVGGDVRDLQVQQENEKFKAGRNIWMEANVQASVTLDQFTFFESFGQIRQDNQSLVLKPTKAYASYQFTDELSLRVGHYVPIYGLNIPQHNFFIRRNLNFGPGSERGALDLQYNGENYNFVIGYSKSSLDSAVRDEEQAINIQIQKNVNDQHKIGFNYWYGEGLNSKKVIVGLQAVLGWTERFYTLAEVDHQWLMNNVGNEEKSVNELVKLGYEFEKGFHLQAVQEWTSSPADDVVSYGAGAAWYPRPHFEFETLYSKKMSAASTSGIEDYVYLLSHFYF